MSYRVDLSLDAPPSRQLTDALLDRIASGALEAGARLHSVRALAEAALVNPNTVAKVYRELELQGVLKGHNGLGVFVSADGPRIARARRNAATLLQLRQAVVEALRAGHEPEVLEEMVREVANAVEPVPSKGNTT